MSLIIPRSGISDLGSHYDTRDQADEAVRQVTCDLLVATYRSRSFIGQMWSPLQPIDLPVAYNSYLYLLQGRCMRKGDESETSNSHFSVVSSEGNVVQLELKTTSQPCE